MDAGGCEGRDTIDVTYAESIVCRPIRFVTDMSAPGEITFSQNITGGVLYEWDFGDGESSQDSGSEITHTYMSAGQFTACLMVTDACGEICTQCVTLSTSTSDLNLDSVAVSYTHLTLPTIYSV